MRYHQAAFLAVFAVHLTVVAAKAQPHDGATSTSVAQEQQSDAESPAIHQRAEATPSLTTVEAAPSRLVPPENAEQPLSKVSLTERDHEVWYGWQNILSDIASVGLIAASDSANAPPLAYVGLAGYVAGSPVIHAINGSGERSLISAGLRLGLPLIGGITAYAMTTSHTQTNEDGDLGPALEIAGGIVAGAIVAMVIDDIFVARKSIPGTAQAQLPHSQLHLTPLVSKDVRGVACSLVL